MPPSYYTSQGSYSARTKSKPWGKLIFFLFIVGLFAFGGYQLYLNKDRILFYFQKDKYKQLKAKLQTAYSVINSENTIDNEETVKSTIELLENLSADHPTDPQVFAFKGHLYYKIFARKVKPRLLLDLFFTDYLDRYKFAAELDHMNWRNAMIAYRKSLALEVEEADRKQIIENLARLYLWGGRAYFESGYVHLRKRKDNSTIASLYNVILTQREPAWGLLEKEFSKELTDFLKALYFLKTGNEPGGFSILKDLAVAEFEQDGPLTKALQNNAKYLLGNIMGRQKKWKSQLKNYSTIEFASFLEKNPWFLKEYNYLLRYLGKKKEATAFLSKYEKRVIN